MKPATLYSVWIAVSLLFVSGCMVNPVTLEQQFNVISEDREINIGRQAHPEIIKQFGYYQNPDLQRYVNEIGQKLVTVCKRRDITYHFTVLDTPIENAFAVPGGYIYITRGLLAYLNSEAELAGVLAHEIGHIVGRDSANQISQAMLAQIAALAGAAAGSASSGDAAAATSLLLNSVMLGFGREKEYLADAQGVEYMYKAGYDPMQMASFQRSLSQISQSPIGLQQYNMTHPNIFDRIDQCTARAKVMMAMNTAMSQINNQDSVVDKTQNSSSIQILSEKYKEYLEGLAYGPKENLRHIKIYTTMEGDTLSLIAKKTLGSELKAKELAELNGIPPEMQLVAGSKIKTIF
ncbi:MAG: M48 family metalloprotease [Proteobacteria bacterium]|nr:M48 family metalloprotease [Pseudomonadota bacterium]